MATKFLLPGSFSICRACYQCIKVGAVLFNSFRAIPRAVNPNLLPRGCQTELDVSG